MHCLKCGREMEEGQVFCQDCLLDMGRHPVDPNVVVFVPKRGTSNNSKKASRKRQRSPEEQILKLKRKVRLLTALTILLFALVAAMIVTVFLVYQRYQFPRGQNYRSVAMTTTVETSEAETQ